MPIARYLDQQPVLQPPALPRFGQPTQQDRRGRRARRGCGSRRRQQAGASEGVQVAKYAAGVAAGVVVVSWIKARIRRLPVVGLLATPFLSLMPTLLLGGVVGAAVVYGLDEGDMHAAKKLVPKVRQHLKAAHQEVQGLAGEVQRSVAQAHAQHMAVAQAAARESESAVSRLAQQLESASREAGAKLAPVAEHHARAIAGEIRRAEQQAQRMQQQQQQQQQQEQQQQQRVRGGSGRSSSSSRRGALLLSESEG